MLAQGNLLGSAMAISTRLPVAAVHVLVSPVDGKGLNPGKALPSAHDLLINNRLIPAQVH